MPEDVKNEDVLKWWFERQHIYPNLSRMALDYHTIPCKFFFYSQMRILRLIAHEQVAPLRWSGSSVKAASFYHTSAIAFHRNRRVLFYASATGAGTAS